MAIDPGNKTSGWVIMHGREFVSGESEMNNAVLLALIPDLEVDLVVCEWIQSYGMAVGKEVFDTCRWTGRFEQTALNERLDFRLIYRRDVKLHLCRTTRAKDTNIRQAILDSYPASGGGATPQVGTKSSPGPLYGVKGHMWPAVGLALTVQESEQLTEVA